MKEGDLIRHGFNSAVLVIKEVLSNNRLKVNFHEPHVNQQDWVVYRVDCIEVK